MRRSVSILLLCLVATGLQAQSVTISEKQWAELKAILQVYMTTTEKLALSLADSQTTIEGLSTSLSNSATRIADLQTGFGKYKTLVDELLPKAKRLEGEVFWLQVALCAAGALGLGLAVWVAVK